MTRHLASCASLAALVTLVLAGCGGATVKVAARTPPAVSAPAPKPTEEAASDHSLRRSSVRSVVKEGLGAFLQSVVLDDQPVMKEGRFHGFKIDSLDPGFWTGVDLRPGDVVVRVNGMPIEHPEEALVVFRALEVAGDLRVEYERDGQGRELRYAIVDDDGAKAPNANAQ